jgi:hypothetical protein
MARCRRPLIVALAFFVVFIPMLAPGAGTQHGQRLAPGKAPARPYRLWLESQPPAAPLSARVAYRTPAASEAEASGNAQPSPTSDIRNYAIVINSTLYADSQIQAALATYISDVENEDLTVELISTSTTSALAVRNLLISRYEEPDSLEGCFFIGDLPPRWYQCGWDEEFPCELYFMDLNGYWIDSDSNGIYDGHQAGLGDEGPEIYCGRIVAHKLTYDYMRDEVSLIVRYLNKVHNYRQGLATTNGRMCLYVDDPWRWWTGQYANEIEQVWQQLDIYDDPYETIASDYLDKIQIPYEHLRVNVHFGAYGHGFGIPPEEHGGDVSPWDLLDDPPEVLTYHLYCCVAARWTWPNIIGCWYVMTGKGLGVFGSSKSGGINDATELYGPLSQWHSFGYSLMYWFDSFAPYSDEERDWTMGMLWLGDPTLTRRPLPPSPFELTSPDDGAQFSNPSVLLSWEASVPVHTGDTISYTLIVDDDADFSSPELVVEDITNASYQLTPGDGLSGLWQYWKVVATTDESGLTTVSSNTRSLTIALDGDNDGMGDDWESANGLDPLDSADALFDTDRDGLLNCEEYELESDPNNDQSPFWIYVDDDNAGDPAQDGTAAHPYEAIQLAIDAATPPAVVKVLPGSYTENVVMASGVWVIGAGPSKCSVAPATSGATIDFTGVDNGRLAGLAITASTADYNVSIRSHDSETVVRDCTVTGGWNGLGINHTGHVQLVNCLIADNTYQGMWIGGTGTVELVNCTVANNVTYGLVCPASGGLTLKNSIFWGNGDDLHIDQFVSTSVLYCNVGDGDYAGTNGNFSANPQFVSGPLHSYYLSQTVAGQGETSPCVDAGDSSAHPGRDQLTTRTDGKRDTSPIDIGYHSVAFDDDDDGLADDWETAHGLDPTDATDALHDADGDWLLNCEEYELESDPTSGASPGCLYVDDDNAGDPAQDGTAAHPYEAIQTAIDAATAPAVVKVLPGNDTENVVMVSDVWVIGAGPGKCSVVPASSGATISFTGVNNGRVAGLAITASTADYNVSIRSHDSEALVRDCTLTGGWNGVGINYTGSVTFNNCLIADNTYQGMWIGGTGTVELVNCTVANNANYGLVCAASGGLTLKNSVFWGNGDDLYIDQYVSTSVLYCNIGDGDYAGTNGNFSANPLFVGGPLHGYYLSQTAAGQSTDSPCVDGGDPSTNSGLDRQTTRTDSTRDTGPIDIGYHAAYALCVTSIAHGSDVTIEWNAQPNLNYVVEWSVDRETWHEIDVGQTASWTDTDTAAYERKFYRVREK